MPQPLSPALAQLCAELAPDVCWDTGVLIEQGSQYVVAVDEEHSAHYAIRFARQDHAAAMAALQRSQALIEHLIPAFHPASIALPQVVGTPVHTSYGPAAVTKFIAGATHPPVRANPGQFRHGGADEATLHRALLPVVSALAQARPPAELLVAPYSYRGDWDEQKTQRTLRWCAVEAAELLPDLESVIDQLQSLGTGCLDGVQPGLVHGDLAGANMRWRPDFTAVAGILDWDLACWWDPAINFMHLGLWHGEQTIARFVTTLARQQHDTVPEADEPEQLLARMRFYSGVWAAENLSHAALRSAEAAAAVPGVRPIKPQALRRLWAKLGPRISAAATALAPWQ